MLSEGTAAPDFELPGTDGGQEFETYRLSEYTENGPVVLVFYPFDFSPVCTTELCNFRDAEWLTMSDQIDVFGISRDACYAHNRFIEEYNLSFPLLSDVEGTVTGRYDVQYEELELHPGIPKRGIAIVDRNGSLQYTWVTEDAYDSPDVRELAREVVSLPGSDIEIEDVPDVA